MKETNLSRSTFQKIWKDDLPVRSDVIDKLCETYNLEIEEVIRRRKKGEE